MRGAEVVALDHIHSIGRVARENVGKRFQIFALTSATNNDAYCMWTQGTPSLLSLVKKLSLPQV